MSLEYIYVARHGFRSNWVVDPSTGDYTAMIPSPTGIAVDPALTAHGVDQARELAAHLQTFGRTGAAGVAAALQPVERIYSSPWYRCLQTVQPFVEAVAATTVKDEGTSWWAVRCEPGLVDWFGPAPFAQPQPAPIAELQSFFPWINAGYGAGSNSDSDIDNTSASAPPLPHGETMAQLHARVAAAATHVVRQCDAEGVRAVLICSHAATVIALGRALTGTVPADVAEEDVGAFTCGLSVYRRRRPIWSAQNGPALPQTRSDQNSVEHMYAKDYHVQVPWDDQWQTLASQAWAGGRGVEGGWDCVVNCDCSFLSSGEERGWRFSGDDESFAGAGQAATGTATLSTPTPGTDTLLRAPIVDASLALGAVVEGRSTDRAQTTALAPTMTLPPPTQDECSGSDGSASSTGGTKRRKMTHL